MVRRSTWFRLFLLCTLIAVVAYFARSRWLPWLATPLVEDDGAAKADMVVVLAGDSYGYRIEKGASLVRQGYAPLVLVSGPPYYATHECEPAIAFAVSKGYPAEWFVPLPHSALSTREEAAIILAELRRRKIQSFLLVTSGYHTARAGRLFRQALLASGGGMAMRVVPSADRYFQPQTWWHNREGQKIMFFELSKGLANAVGM